MEYKPTIGLEIHSELKTKTKMFCGCLNNPDEKNANTNICPICLAHPGVLPTINKEAIENVLKVGLALGGNPQAGGSKFDRKNYFYPDLPKGYQISQYDQPIISGGKLYNVRIRRIHLEEDTGRLIHSSQLSDYPKSEPASTLVDFNRAGVPLMELVTEPDITSGKEAVLFAKELQLILRYLEVSDADMEKGHMRIEANISLRNKEQETRNKEFGTKVEVKNINSFAAVEKAIDYEIKRQAEILEKGEKIIQETRGWDDKKKKTISQRIKEEAHDYRYFPEPDLPPLNLSPELGVFNLKALKLAIPELPEQKRQRFQKEYGLNPNNASALIEDMGLSDFFENSLSELNEKTKNPDVKLLFNYLTSDLKGMINEQGIEFSQLKISPEHFAHLIFLASSKNWTSRMTKEVLKEMAATGEDPENIMKAKSFHETLDENVVKQAIEEIIAANSKAVVDYKSGQENALQFLVGQAMAKLKGRADPQVLRELIKNKLVSK